MIRNLLIIISLIFLYSCNKDEIKIETKKSPQPVAVTTVRSADDTASKPLIKVKNTDVIKVFVRADGAPGMYLGEDGKVHGFYVDLEKMVEKKMNQAYEFVPYTNVGPIVQAMKTGTGHIALSVPDLPDYRSFLNLSIPYEVLNYVTFIKKGNKEISGKNKTETIKSLFGKKVGVQTRGHIYQALRDYKEIQLIEYPTTTKALAALDKGLLDAVPDVKRIGIYYSKKNHWDIEPIGEPIIRHLITTAISKQYDRSLLERYNAALGKIIADGRLKKLFESYFGPMRAENRPEDF